MRKDRKAALEATYKSKETEEWLDIKFTRPVGYALARVCAHLHIHPNVITVISIILGVAAAVCFYFKGIWWTVAGILLLVSANILDSVDGQLARMTGQKSLLGRVLDGFAGDVWFFSIYLAISFRLMDSPMPFFPEKKWGVWIFLLAMVVSLFSHMFQANLADYIRNMYLQYRTGSSELSSTDDLNREQASIPWSDWFRKVWIFFYTGYVRRQELCTPAFQHMRMLIRSKWPDMPDVDFCRDFSDGIKPLVKWANILTFNTRAIVLYLIMLIGEPWLYLVFEITVMNALLFYVILSEESVSRHVTNKYLAG